MTTQQKQTAKLAKMGMLAAISILLMALIHIPFPLLPFLEYDPADISIMVGTFAYGPLAGLVITIIVSLIQGALFASTGPYGVLMHIIATGTFVIVAGNIYRHSKSKKTAIIALIAGTLAMTAIMLPANYIITPIFFGMPRASVIPMLPGIALFNVMKAGINSVLTFLIYKRISPFLHR
ncbi:MAG: ECF transporter S component [Selenomonas sp.]|nr:ECF transporter S component [Selenomonas sp.]